MRPPYWVPVAYVVIAIVAYANTLPGVLLFVGLSAAVLLLQAIFTIERITRSRKP